MIKAKLKMYTELITPGFWVYVVEVTDKREGPADRRPKMFYVGHAGFVSKEEGGSPWSRLLDHLDANPEGDRTIWNTLRYYMRKNKLDVEKCYLEMTAFGPIPVENAKSINALERDFAAELRRRGYNVVGNHPRGGRSDPELLTQVLDMMGSYLPDRSRI